MTQTTERLKLAEFIARHGITATSTRAEHNPHYDGHMDDDHWRVTLYRSDAETGMRKRPYAKLTIYFSMGSAHGGRAPEVADVLDCMASDSAGIEHALGDHEPFYIWCRDLGYDTDSRKAHRTYTICKRQAERLRKFLGETAYNQLLWETERL